MKYSLSHNSNVKMIGLELDYPGNICASINLIKKTA